MSMNEFNARLTSSNNSSAILGSLRKLMSLSDAKLALFQDTSDQDVVNAWVIWNEPDSGFAATA